MCDPESARKAVACNQFDCGEPTCYVCASRHVRSAQAVPEPRKRHCGDMTCATCAGTPFFHDAQKAEPRKRLTFNGKFVLTSADGHTVTPLVKLSQDEIRIGCHSISRIAWLKLHESWEKYRAADGVVQEGDES